MTDWTPSKWFQDLPFVVHQPEPDLHALSLIRELMDDGNYDGILVDDVPVEEWLAAFPLDRVH